VNTGDGCSLGSFIEGARQVGRDPATERVGNRVAIDRDIENASGLRQFGHSGTAQYRPSRLCPCTPTRMPPYASMIPSAKCARRRQNRTLRAVQPGVGDTSLCQLRGLLATSPRRRRRAFARRGSDLVQASMHNLRRYSHDVNHAERCVRVIPHQVFDGARRSAASRRSEGQ
jgi:hypothetical protein